MIILYGLYCITCRAQPLESKTLRVTLLNIIYFVQSSNHFKEFTRIHQMYSFKSKIVGLFFLKRLLIFHFYRICAPLELRQQACSC